MGFCVFEATSKRVDNLWLAGILLSQQLMPGIRLEYFLFNDRSRSQIPKWCRQHKLEVVIGGEPAVLHELQRSHLFPDKVDYVTTDWIEAEKEIAGIDQRPDKLGAAAVDLLIAQIQRGERGIPEVPVTTLIEGEWIDGDSVQRKLVQK